MPPTRQNISDNSEADRSLNEHDHKKIIYAKIINREANKDHIPNYLKDCSLKTLTTAGTKNLLSLSLEHSGIKNGLIREY